MNESYFESIIAIFDEKSPFLSILDTFWAIFPFDQYQWSPDYWIELSFELNQHNFFLNWIIFWIESWVKQYWIDYWMNHYLAKFKHWIESDWVSPTPSPSSSQALPMWRGDKLCVRSFLTTLFGRRQGIYVIKSQFVIIVLCNQQVLSFKQLPIAATNSTTNDVNCLRNSIIPQIL